MSKVKGKGDYFYKMEFDAWDEGTVDLSLEEEAAYLRLCHQMYRRRGPVPNSDRLLVSLWRCHQNKARPLLQRLIAAGKIFLTPEGYLSNTRVTHEVDARETLSTHRADAGHTGGIRSGDARRKPLKTHEPDEAKRSIREEKREEKKRGEDITSHPSGGDRDSDGAEHRGGDEFQSSRAPEPASSPEPSTQLALLETEPSPNQEMPRAPGTAVALSVPPRPAAHRYSGAGFEAWYAVYPLKKSKIAAEKKYAAIVKAGGVSEAELLEGARRYASEKAGSEARYIKHPEVWLNKGCWLDEAGPLAGQHKFAPRSPGAQHLLNKIINRRTGRSE